MGTTTWDRLAKDAASLGLEPVDVLENGNCILEAARITRETWGGCGNDRPRVADCGGGAHEGFLGFSHWTWHADVEGAVGISSKWGSKQRGGTAIRDGYAGPLLQPRMFLEGTALPSLAQVLNSPIVVIGAAPDVFGNTEILTGSPLVLLFNVQAHHVRGTQAKVQWGRGATNQANKSH